MGRHITTLLLLAVCGLTRAANQCPSDHEFVIELTRLGVEQVTDKGSKVDRIYGDIGVHGMNLGRFYESPAVKIPAGTYKGLLRYHSEHNFVQSACGELGHEGDFLLEIANVHDQSGKQRTNILLHPGELPSHSQGCVLLGSRKRDANHKLLPLDSQSPLAKLRREFYGTDEPNQCPNKSITVVVSDPST